MPRSRSSEASSQRQSPRVPLHLKTTASSEANSLHRLNTDRISPKPDDHRSPRGGGGALHRPHEKKRGTKVADLETRLGHAQDELKKLKDQLASAEAAKRDAEHELQETKKQIPAATTAAEEEEATHEPEQQQEEEEEQPKINTESPASTDVFEVVPCPTAPSEIEGVRDEKIESLEKTEVKGAMSDVEAEEKSKTGEFPEIPEVTELRAKLAEKEKELEIRLLEKEALTQQASEAAERARAKEEELWAKVGRVEEELRESRAKGERLGEKLDAAAREKEALEAEMKKMRVQSEQWRKAAEAAAAVLSAGEGGGRRAGERCGSMDKHLNSSGYGSVWSPVMKEEEIAAAAAAAAAAGRSVWSPVMEEEVIVAAAGGDGGKRKSSGIRMFGDLWKKKGQYK